MRLALCGSIALWLLCGPAFAEKTEAEAEAALEKRAYDFFQTNEQGAKSRFAYNPYENIISGVAAFVIGNVGYLTTDSSSLKLTFSAIQTIGIVNVGQGIYKSQAPAMDESLRDILADQREMTFTKEKLARRMLRIFAEEDRAKRLSIFYSSSFLTIQYAMNATIYKSSGQLRKVYLFLGGVNAIVAMYSALNKSVYEQAYFGEKTDLIPVAWHDGQNEPAYGLSLAVRF